MELSTPALFSQDPQSALKRLLEDESAVQFLRKANARPFVTGLRLVDQEIPHGLRAGDVLELFGASGSGKSELMLGMLVMSILPQRFGELDFGGNELGVIYFDNDLKFNLARLVRLLEHRWEAVSERARHDDRFSAAAGRLRDDPAAKEQFLTSTLERLLLYRCTDSLQFAATLASLDTLLRSRENMRVLMIDTISAFYWQDKQEDATMPKPAPPGRAVISASARAPTLIARLLSQHNLVVVAAKGRLGAPRANAVDDEKEYLSPVWQRMIKYSISLTRDHATSSSLVTARFARIAGPNAPAGQPAPPPPKTGHFRIENDGVVAV